LGQYERSIAIAGRTEVVTIRSDGSEFAAWSFREAALALDPDAAPSTGPVELRLDRGAEARLVRTSRGPLTVTFAARPEPGHARPEHGSCTNGAEKVGSVSKNEGTAADLCDGAQLRIEAAQGNQPI